MSVTTEGAISTELSGINLGDKRLNARSERLITSLASNSQASINSACVGWTESLAAYRFLDNPKVTPEKILEPHKAATLQRMQSHSVVLIPQDTTEFDFTNHPAYDAKCLNTETRYGFFEHVQMAVTPEGLSLGVVGRESFDREPESLGQTKSRRKLPIQEKESYRWLNGYRNACEIQESCPDTQVVSIADREGDIYDLFVEYRDHVGPRADLIVRALQDRKTLTRRPDKGPCSYQKVYDEVRASKLLHTLKIELEATPKRAKRSAKLAVRAATVTVKAPHARQRLKPVTINIVLVEEVGGPGDGTDVSWQLITSLPIDTLEKTLLVVKYYQQRWLIEIYFRTLKTGCTIEEMRLGTTARTENALALYEIIAWRIMYVTYLNRTNPDDSCETAFAPHEWKSVWYVTKKTPPPKKPPTLAEFIKLLTELGGYNNRSKDRAPGPQAFWQGLRRMHDLALAYLAFGPGADTCV